MKNILDITADFWIEKIEIFSASGVRVLVGANGIRSNETHRIDLKDFVKGVYFVRIYGNSGVVTQKLVVR